MSRGRRAVKAGAAALGWRLAAIRAQNAPLCSVH